MIISSKSLFLEGKNIKKKHECGLFRREFETKTSCEFYLDKKRLMEKDNANERHKKSILEKISGSVRKKFQYNFS